MAHAWLDSLSDDWVEQPGSDESLPPLPSKTHNVAKPTAIPSRIPLRADGSRPLYSPSSPNSSNVLIERSANEINMTRNRRTKLSNEVKIPSGEQRSVSIVTNGSVVHRDVPAGSSPERNGSIPEWKQRLVYGQLQYGEQRDLFCSAGTGLQDMFKPPEAEEDTEQNGSAHEITMPSSPPGYQYGVDAELDRLLGLAEEDEHEYPEQVTPSPSPRRAKQGITFQKNFDDESTFAHSQGSANFYQETPIRQVSGPAQTTDDALNLPPVDQRKISGQSVIQNEDFSPIFVGRHDQNGKIDFGLVQMPADELHDKLERLQLRQLTAESPKNRALFQGNSVSHESDIDAAERFAKHSGQINLRRGGRSADGSFYNRALSPDLGVDTSEMLPEESLQASTPKEYPTIRTEAPSMRSQAGFTQSPSVPRAPFPSPDKKQLADASQNGSTKSPLKLFGAYDTFTNQTLLRRISQFEEPGFDSPSPQSPIDHDAEQALHNARPDGARPTTGRRKFSQFGDGDLNGFEFTGDITSDTGHLESPSLLSVAAAPAYPFSQRYASRVQGRLQVQRRRDKSGQTVDESTAPGTPQRKFSSADKYLAGDDSGFEGKRPRTSPVKDPTPKRRRTLHRTDIAFGLDELQSRQQPYDADTSDNSVRKRQDSIPGEFELASPEVLATRSILQPQSPGSSRSSSFNQTDSLLHQAEAKQDDGMQQHEDVRNGTVPQETDRKPSIRTQDFVDQAAQIMAMIRNQVKPPGMASVEESEEDHEDTAPVPAEQSNVSYQESTYEPLSRPPSRETKPMPALAEHASDPNLADRLRKYREFSDMGDVITSSMRSVNLAHDAIKAAKQVEQQVKQRSLSRSTQPLSVEGDIVSDLPNVRITASSQTDSDSNASAPNTNNSVPTTSSRASDSRRTILPDTVSHLIPDRVGSMYLDKKQNVWIKTKGEEQEEEQPPSPGAENSDEDPFASIPDLSVDITQEMANLHRAVNPPGLAAEGDQPMPRMVSAARHELAKLENRARSSLIELDGAQPLADRGPAEELRGNTASTRRKNMTITFSSPIASVIQDFFPEDLDSLEDDDGSFEQLGSADSSKDSSPLGAPSHTAAHSDYGSLRSNGSGSSRYASIRGQQFIPRPVSRIDEQDEESTVELPLNQERQVSILGDNSLMANRQTPDRRQTSLSVILNQPRSTSHALTIAADESGLIGQNVGKLSLSPLSEFTLNNVDQSFGLEVSYVMGHRHMSTGDGSKRVLSMTIRDLVDRLSEVEPFEPYWEDIAELDIHDKRLSSLHMLDEFCGQIVSLDASMNELGHLEGIPACVRHLKVSQNRLTELTSWDHLMNLQYVDISGNDIKSLSALKNLVHLRSVRADSNQLTSLDGLDQHDGLLSLRVRDNQIEELDFDDYALNRLTDLDVSNNHIHSVRNLNSLPCLSRLSIGQNNLRSFVQECEYSTLRLLDVSDNQLTELDVGKLVNLHTLHADRNCISTVSGLQRSRRLDSLSLREQRGEESLNMDFLTSGYEIRKLYLSGNLLGSLQIKVDMLNLQLLDLANCGLDKLPQNLGQLMPNVRTLNINFNAISDLSPLRYIPRLKKLLVAGNRLADSTLVTELLTDFPHLTRLDVRDNPMTLGFYAPWQALVSTNGQDRGDRFTLPDADKQADGLYARRLDDTTKLRRRLHQVVLAASCKRLKMLDGLSVERSKLLAMDDVLQSLVDEGLLPDISKLSKSGKSGKVKTDDEAEVKHHEEEAEVKAEEVQKAEVPQSSIWHAEDSFA